MPKLALQEQELDLALTIVTNSSLKKHELHKQVHELSQKYTRSEKSLYILAVRLFYVLHGKMPANITDNSGWYKVSRTLVSFVLSRGHEISDVVKEEMSKEKPVVDREQARKLMSEYYKNNKTWMPDSVKSKRDFILDRIQEGLTAEDAFMAALTKG